MLEVATCDVVFLSFDEPNADANFARLTELAPRAQRVHGVAGFDAAHRRAGEIASSPHVVTIDGDNLVTDPGFFTARIDLAPRDLGSVLSFRAFNPLNGLEYGNGGVKVWPRTTLLTLRTHERAARPEAALDFWTVPFFLVDRTVSEVRVTTTAYQAFRAGFREGVKFNLLGGRLAYAKNPRLPRAKALLDHIGETNIERLRIWCSVGADVRFGDWAMFGARLGCVRTALQGFDPTLISDYGWFDRFWAEEIEATWAEEGDRGREFKALGRKLDAELGLALDNFDAAESASFKSRYRCRRAFGELAPT